VVWWSYPVGPDLFAKLPGLKFMQRVGVVRTKGDATAALARGVPVSVIPLGLSDRVALHALALTLAVTQKIVQGHRAVPEGTNPDNLPEELAGAAVRTVNWARLPNVDTINDKTVGMVGFGEIGACFSRMVRPWRR
jgi:phosphoglycerate dehydrogenase-like enzyme